MVLYRIPKKLDYSKRIDLSGSVEDALWAVKRVIRSVWIDLGERPTLVEFTAAVSHALAVDTQEARDVMNARMQPPTAAVEWGSGPIPRQQ